MLLNITLRQDTVHPTLVNVGTISQGDLSSRIFGHRKDKMAFEWQKFLDLARAFQKQAAGSGQDDALLRTAFSRAYYAAYCHARNYARNWLNFAARNDVDDHGRLRAHLSARRRRGDADRLERLRDLRNECDYQDELSFELGSTIAIALHDAGYIFSSLRPPEKP